MATTPVNSLTNIGNIADSDKLVGERVDGTTVRITFNGVLYDADFATNGIMCRTASATYANRTLTGVTDKTTITNGDGVSGDPTVDIAATYAGQTSITTVGTLATGTWQATAVTVPYGGNGRATATAYAPICGGTTATGAHQSTASGSTGQLFVSQGSAALPTWTTPTYPTSSQTAGKILRSDGTNIVGSTSTFADTYTASNLLYSNGANTVTGLATANNGVLVTNGSGVPAIGTDIPTAVTIGGQYSYRAGGTDVPVTDGGTGVSTMTTAYAPVCAGTTATGALQVASTGLSTSGYVLTSNGASALPSFQAPASGGFVSATIQVFTSSGTYTPTSGMKYCIVELVGSGAGGGGAASTTSSQVAGAGGGGAGKYSKAAFSAATIGASQTITIGAAGAGGTAGANDGSNGATTSIGTLMTAAGGTGGTGAAATGTAATTAGGAGGSTGTAGTYNVNGQAGGAGVGVYTGASAFYAKGGAGGSSALGTGGAQFNMVNLGGSNNTGAAGSGYGAGGTGACNTTSCTATAGGAGTAGVCIITEFV